MFNNYNDEVLLQKVSEKTKLYVIFKSKSSFTISK